MHRKEKIAKSHPTVLCAHEQEESYCRIQVYGASRGKKAVSCWRRAVRGWQCAVSGWQRDVRCWQWDVSGWQWAVLGWQWPSAAGSRPSTAVGGPCATGSAPSTAFLQTPALEVPFKGSADGTFEVLLFGKPADKEAACTDPRHALEVTKLMRSSSPILTQSIAVSPQS